MASILVTGSEGCIGPYLIHALLQSQPDLHVIRLSRRGEVVRGQRQSTLVGDLNDPRFLDALFENEAIRYVIHAAGTRYSSAAFETHPFELFENDLGSLLALLRRSDRLEKFVFLSSAAVYERVDASPLSEDFTESYPPAESPFGSSKQAAERMIKFFSKQSGVACTIWRLFNVVSPRESVRSPSGHVFVDFFRQIYIEQVPTLKIKGSGAQTRCFTWVDDVARPIAACLRDRRSNDQTFNLGHAEPHSLFELAQKLVQIGHQKGYLPSDYSPEVETGGTFFGVDSQARIPDVRKVRQLLGVECPTPFDVTFEAFVDEVIKHEKH